ncbi:MAG: histidine--tRNA ligase [Candidatus Harrisonbacteria bacterium RIFCSPLOWO2_02_FULL_41_13b]|uniref:Histidine--tRNA ligase n=1 Tax=Candidatus Harrisonbacteria bacterium RIFCSPLOWO2_02_FULL_41_13b TaxID=1798409 RepID=A0A1G1ZQM3_9BACT|nr:MAG: histidine--tRNA ligase [Candidatus Harrisonbacteria bacterium RIFCSPHIGHO2_02_FULL_40_20]OGY66842.1 MAG: histidine--tRNA ligase [Candidatus Harrisonbacteria bacterium RIFCSPLOWO2_02_FULL_41_13b]
MKKSKNKNLINSPKGMHDILPQDQPIWEKMRKVAKDISDSYNFSRIDTPIVEYASLYERPLGAGSDVVEKQMFILNTKGGDGLALRPEGTAGVSRAYLQHGLSHLAQPLKLYYEGPMFRYEHPQAGRFRQFYQSGFEIIGSEGDAVYDVQVILACVRLLETLKIKNLSIEVNTIGCRTCRPNYRRKLLEYYKGKEKKICADCQRRLKNNPLRVLDCKEDICQPFIKEAPIMLENLCVFCNKHFKAVLDHLEELALPYRLNNHLVRGFDYYNRTVFEIFTEGFAPALAAGGRYDYLMEMIGGRATPAVGGAIGLDRLVEIIKSHEINLIAKKKPKIFLVHIGDEARKKALTIVESLLLAGIDVYESLGKDSLRAQLKIADKIASPLALIFGQQEVFEQTIIIRDMKTGAQETVPLVKIANVLKKRLK